LGAYFISEHLSPRQWASHFGHKNFAFHSYKGQSEEASELEYKKILRWCMDTRRKISMEEASKYIDLDNLTRYIFAVIYCGTSDGFQGAAMLDTSKPGSKWFWVNWDMDATSLGDPWKRGAWKWGFSRKGCSDVQSIIFTRLVSECPQYCEYLVPLVVDTLNHRINQKFLKSRIEYYDQLAMAYGINEKSFQSDKPFFKERADCVMKEMRYIKQLNVGEYLTCKVAGPANLEYDIDGYSEQAGYQGKYFKGMSIRVEITSEHNNQLSHWLVNGKSLTGDILEYPIVVDTVIEPILVD
jgi:hypothetical protein